MDFNSDLWITIGTASPVIALSCILLINDQSEIVNKEQIAKKVVIGAQSIGTRKWTMTAFNLVNYVFMVNTVNIAIQTVAFMFALISLANGRSFAPEVPIAIAEALSILLLLIASGFTSAAKVRIRSYETRSLTQKNALSNRFYMSQNAASKHFDRTANLKRRSFNSKARMRRER